MLRWLKLFFLLFCLVIALPKYVLNESCSLFCLYLSICLSVSACPSSHPSNHLSVSLCFYVFTGRSTFDVPTYLPPPHPLTCLFVQEYLCGIQIICRMIHLNKYWCDFYLYLTDMDQRLICWTTMTASCVSCREMSSVLVAQPVDGRGGSYVYAFALWT